MIHLRVTDLESFRYWRDSEDSTLEGLIARLMHTDPPTPQMRAGTAFAKIMEHAGERSLHVEEQDGWEFFFDLDTEIDWPPVRELGGEMVINTPVGPVTLTGHCDAIGGPIHDAKLTESVDAERYTDSLQWRAYLVMFDRREFVYDLFKARYERGPGSKDEDGEYVRGEPTGKVTIDEHHRLRFFAYPAMRADVERAVCELAEVVATHLPQEPTP